MYLVDTRYTKYASTNAHDTGTIGVTTTIATICSITEANLITTVCPKWGTQKSGQRSCCARGGSWFGKCGDPADSDLEHTHTWSECLKTCEATVAEATPTTQGQSTAGVTTMTLPNPYSAVRGHNVNLPRVHSHRGSWQSVRYATGGVISLLLLLRHHDCAGSGVCARVCERRAVNSLGLRWMPYHPNLVSQAPCCITVRKLHVEWLCVLLWM